MITGAILLIAGIVLLKFVTDRIVKSYDNER